MSGLPKLSSIWCTKEHDTCMWQWLCSWALQSTCHIQTLFVDYLGVVKPVKPLLQHLDPHMLMCCIAPLNHIHSIPGLHTFTTDRQYNTKSNYIKEEGKGLYLPIPSCPMISAWFTNTISNKQPPWIGNSHTFPKPTWSSYQLHFGIPEGKNCPDLPPPLISRTSPVFLRSSAITMRPPWSPNS